MILYNLVCDSPHACHKFHVAADACFVHVPVAQGVPTTLDILQATRRATAMIHPDVTAQVSASPMDEFHNNDALIAGCFPDKFLLGLFYLNDDLIHTQPLIPIGEGVQKAGSLGNRERMLLLSQHDNRFSTCMPLVFTLFNQLQRHVCSTPECESIRMTSVSGCMSEHQSACQKLSVSNANLHQPCKFE